MLVSSVSVCCVVLRRCCVLGGLAVPGDIGDLRGGGDARIGVVGRGRDGPRVVQVARLELVAVLAAVPAHRVIRVGSTGREAQGQAA